MLGNGIEGQPPPNLSIAVRTLTSGGFMLDSVDRKPGYALIDTSRVDEFGCSFKYLFLLAEDSINDNQIAGALIAAEHHGSKLVVIGRGANYQPTIDWLTFLNMLGGPVIATTPLDTNFRGELIELGLNRLPASLVGEPDELFEIYVNSALQYIFGGQVKRYGQLTRFEKKPDGIAIPNAHFTALYDTKAYSAGYEVTVDTLRQFKDYVGEFDNRYSAFYRLNSFILIAGKFANRSTTLEGRSREFLGQTRVPLSFLTAESLADIVKIISLNPLTRRSIDWASIFAYPVVIPSLVQQQIDLIIRDRLIRVRRGNID